MSTNWYYVEDGKQKGPISSDALVSKLEAGQITLETFVWREGLSSWTALKSIPSEEYSQAKIIPNSYSRTGAASSKDSLHRLRKERALEFTGSGKEYFGIWIVNLLLTIVTLGIYTPWAKVRTRRYFYQHTKLFDEPFEYLADPKKILIGFIIIAVFYGAYVGLQYIDITLSVIALVLFTLVYPYLIFKSLRFKAMNSAYRNVTFRFIGSVGGAYKWFLGIYVLFAIVIGGAFMIMMGLMTAMNDGAGVFLGVIMGIVIGLSILAFFPFATFKQHEYLYDHVAYGKHQSLFNGRLKFFYKAYLAGGAAVIGLNVVVGILVFAVMSAVGGASQEPAAAGPVFAIIIIPLYIFIYSAYLFIFFAVRGEILKHIWNNMSLGEAFEFKSSLSSKRYATIQVTNIWLMLLTLGIYSPWAKVRLHKYQVEMLTATTNEDIDEITGQAYEDLSAISDSATDFLDIDFGF